MRYILCREPIFFCTTSRFRETAAKLVPLKELNGLFPGWLKNAPCHEVFPLWRRPKPNTSVYRLRDVGGQNLGRVTGYSDWSFRGSLQ
jgi:hypothetical protein